VNVPCVGRPVRNVSHLTCNNRLLLDICRRKNFHSSECKMDSDVITRYITVIIIIIIIIIIM
jgi:hypothetical protein